MNACNCCSIISITDKPLNISFSCWQLTAHTHTHTDTNTACAFATAKKG